MDIHPWMKYEVAQARHEERILRGLAAYHALRVQKEQKAERLAENGSTGRIRILDRVLRREARARARPAI